MLYNIKNYYSKLEPLKYKAIGFKHAQGNIGGRSGRMGHNYKSLRWHGDFLCGFLRKIPSSSLIFQVF